MKNPIILILLLLITGCAGTKKPKTLAELEASFKHILLPLEGDFAVAYKNTGDDKTILINEHERFHAASTMKTPVMIEVFKQAEDGKFDIQDSITIKNVFTSIVDGSPFTMDVDEDSEKDLYTNLGKKTTIYQLTYDMITRSSNLATNILIDLVGAKNVTATMRELGADSINVLRGVEDTKAFEAGLSNTTTANDLLIIFKALASDTLISPKANEMMIDILEDQIHNDMFPVKLPPDTKIAHKTGWITGVHHDSGIIYMPDGEAAILVFLSKNAPDRKAVLDAGATIAKLIYDFELTH